MSWHSTHRISETSWRIISKAILSLLGNDMFDATSPHQLCADQVSSFMAAVHCIRHLYDDNNTEALILVDAINAFNSLNREVALRNSLHLRPSLGRVLVNVYRESVSLFIDDEIIKSAEGTTQGDPMAMAMYALGIMPLIQKLGHINSTSTPMTALVVVPCKISLIGGSA